jgi:hypothetical protein
MLPMLKMRFIYIAASLFGAVQSIVAQQTIWGQCGGKDYSGPTTCVPGAYCQWVNEWYSQCVQGKREISFMVLRC